MSGSRRSLTTEVLDAVIASVPAVWLEGDDPQVYGDYLAARLEGPRGFVAEAEHAR